MSVLVVARHGQASFFAAEYDQLSPLGEEQARRLGQYWARHDEAFDEVYVGPRLRQRQTADLVGEQLRSLGLPWPEPVVVPELDEYDLHGLMTHLLPALALKNPTFKSLVDAIEDSNGDRDRASRFQRMFEMLLLHWQTNSEVGENVESWLAFRDRVQHGLLRITESRAKGRRVAAFSSGGTIGMITALALSTPDRAALELNWRLRNGSLTRFLFSPGRLTLDEFNSVAHLPDPTLWTYR